jgi:hypothetical protein
MYEPIAEEFPLQRKRFTKAPVAGSQTAHILLASPPALRIFMTGSSTSMFGSRILTVAFHVLILHPKNSAGKADTEADSPSPRFKELGTSWQEG